MSHFQSYVRPVKNPRLSEFFTELTGISQEIVDGEGLTYSEALNRFAEWAGESGLYCWGVDLEIMKKNADLVDIAFPLQLERKVDVRSVFEAQGIATRDYNSSTIPKAFGEDPPPSAHDALNDARSIVQGLRALQRKVG